MRRLLEKQGTFDRLKRVHAGEPIEVLAAEFDGVDLDAVDAAAVAEAVAAAVDEEE